MGESGKKKKEKSTFVKQLPVFICFLLIGAVCGFFMGEVLGGMIDEKKELSDILLSVSVLFVGMYLGIFLQTAIHEAGHLVCGLISGYKYSSFRIGSFMWVKKEGRIRLKRMSIAGTGGQCLMEPPAMVDGKVPYVLYNLGGSILNTVTSVVFLGLYFVFVKVPYLSTILLMFSIIGFADALINGVPLRLGTINNDGYNALSLGKDKEALRSFWVQMQANAQTAQGMRLREMPEEWFAMPSEEGLKNCMTATMGVFACSRLLDEMRFEEADALMKQLLEADTAIVDLHRNMMLCDRIYCTLVLGGNRENVDELLTKELKNFMKAMQKFPSVLRTEYVYALLYEDDLKKAEKLLTDFEKVARKHPYASDIESERELIEYAKKNKDSD